MGDLKAILFCRVHHRLLDNNPMCWRHHCMMMCCSQMLTNHLCIKCLKNKNNKIIC